MLLRPFSALALAGALWLLVSPVRAQLTMPPSAAPAADAAEVRAWLLRIHNAASQRNFTGTFVVSAGGVASSARIAHYCEGKNQFERSESLDGQARHVLRHNDQVYTVWPASKTAVLEQRYMPTTFPALLQAGVDRIVDHYEVRPQGVERVAGHQANVLHVKARDELRYGYRLWADQDSGLLLRADVVAPDGAVLESSAFSDVAIGVKPQPESVLQPIRRLDGYRLVRPVLEATRLDAEGWTLTAPAAGFREVSCVKRPIDDAVGLAGEQIVQTIYSDGLTYVSVFIERFDRSRHRNEMLAAVGATKTLMKRREDWWITVVGDVPADTLRLFARSIERKK